MRLKSIGLILVLLLLSLFLTSCSPSKPTIDEMKNDIIGSSIDFYQESLTINSIDEIKEFNIMSDELYKKDRIYEVTIALSVEKEHVEVNTEMTLEYKYIPDEGWHLNMAMDNPDSTELKIIKTIDKKDIEKSIKNRASLRTEYTRKWQLENIESISIESEETDSEDMSSTLILEITSKGEYDLYTAKVHVLYKYDISNDEWLLSDFDTIEEESSLHTSMSVEDIKKLFLNKKISNIITYEYNGETKGIDWDVEDISEIKKLEVIENNSDLDNYKDSNLVGVILEKDNIRCEGIMNISASYSGYEWSLDKGVIEEKFDYKLLEDIDISKIDFEELLAGKVLLYRGTYFIDRWSFNGGVIENLEVKEIYPLDYGNKVSLITSLKMSDSDRRITGDARIILELNDLNEWKFYSVRKIRDFEVEGL